MLSLSKIRLDKGYSQQKLASIVGVSRSTIAMWETGGSQPDNDMLLKLAEILSVSTDTILGREEQKEKPTDNVDELSEDELEILENYRAMTDDEKKAWLKLLNSKTRL